MSLKIGITDDHALFRKSLKLLINSFENMDVVVEASNGVELLNKLESKSVDVLLLDLRMPEMDGFETCKRLNELYPKLKILVLTYLEQINTIRKVLSLDIQGYFTKNTEPSELKNAILKVSNNGFYFEKNLSSIIQYAKNISNNELINDELKHFSKREMQVLKLTIKELSGIEIAERLHISPKTVEKHKRNLMDKTHSKNFIGVIKYALVHEFIEIDTI